MTLESTRIDCPASADPFAPTKDPFSPTWKCTLAPPPRTVKHTAQHLICPHPWLLPASWCTICPAVSAAPLRAAPSSPTHSARSDFQPLLQPTTPPLPPCCSPQVGAHAGLLFLLGRFDSSVYKAYTWFFIVGTLGAIQVRGERQGGMGGFKRGVLGPRGSLGWDVCDDPSVFNACTLFFIIGTLGVPFRWGQRVGRGGREAWGRLG